MYLLTNLHFTLFCLVTQTIWYYIFAVIFPCYGLTEQFLFTFSHTTRKYVLILPY
jgi:hypothetical protein